MFVQTKDPKIVRITGTASCFCGEWRRIIARKHAWCILTRRFINAKDVAYRPIGAGKHKGQRINADVMAEFIKYDAGRA